MRPIHRGGRSVGDVKGGASQPLHAFRSSKAARFRQVYAIWSEPTPVSRAQLPGPGPAAVHGPDGRPCAKAVQPASTAMRRPVEERCARRG